MEADIRWKCHLCGHEHAEPPLCFGADAPWRALVPEAEFESRVDLNDDQCVIDGSTFFLRGHIEIPVRGTGDCFAWSVWCSLSQQSFDHASSRWLDPDREGDRYFGWLCTSLPTYDPSTLNPKANVLSRAVGVVPLVEIQQCEHPLYLEQTNGIDRRRLLEIAHELLHRSST